MSSFTKHILPALAVGALLLSSAPGAFASSAAGYELSYPRAERHIDALELRGLELSPAIPQSTKTVALNFVEASGLDKNLSLMLLDVAKNDALVQAAIKKHGFTLVKTIVVAAITEERATYRAEWSELLAESYARHFTAAQLKSIAAVQTQSPYYEHLISAQHNIAQEMRTLGADVLAKATSGMRARIQSALGA